MIWTIDFDVPDDRITVSRDGVAVAWGTMHYEDDMVMTFRRSQYASGEPPCVSCGHSFLDHMLPSGLELMTWSPGIRGRIEPDACEWGGGLEGWCYCEGYKAETRTYRPDCIIGSKAFIEWARAGINKFYGIKES